MLAEQNKTQSRWQCRTTQCGRHSPSRDCPIKLKSHQWLDETLAMSSRKHRGWLACERLFKTLGICVLLRHILSHTEPPDISIDCNMALHRILLLSLEWYSQLLIWYWISYRKRYIGFSVLQLLLFLVPPLIPKMCLAWVFSILYHFSNMFIWIFLLLVFVKYLFVILKSCIIYLSLFLGVIKISMSTTSLFSQNVELFGCKIFFWPIN